MLLTKQLLNQKKNKVNRKKEGLFKMNIKFNHFKIKVE